MTDILASRRIHDGQPTANSDAERRAAALIVCDRAHDADDARALLVKLGLIGGET